MIILMIRLCRRGRGREEGEEEERKIRKIMTLMMITELLIPECSSGPEPNTSWCEIL